MVRAKYQVEGNFSPGQFSFSTKREADDWSKKKKSKGFSVKVSKINLRSTSIEEIKRFKEHKKRVLLMSKKSK